jgi:mono/diheme cytochrome c family protein
MVDEFHWLWAIEWTFFALEITAGYLFYRYGARLSDRARLRLLALYAAAAWFSLFWINGILSWQLTPGEWEPGAVWRGFFNPSFWPSLLYRTAVATTIAGLVACVVVNGMTDLDREARGRLIRRFAHGMVPVAVMPLPGAWYLAVIPDDSRAWLMGGSIAMTLFSGMAAGASALIGAYAIIGLLRRRLYVNGATALLLVALALGATAGGEFVREGARKPYSVRETLYSNSITPDEVAELRRTGSVAADPYPLRDAEDYPTEQLRVGAKVVRLQCSVCHTMSGANGLDHLSGSWTTEQLRMNIAQLQRTKPYMPPFAGNAAEVEAVVQLLLWRRGEAEAERATATETEAEADVLRRIQTWLDEAGTEPAAGARAVRR